ncbi:MAG: hypothetical protein NTZ56_07285 [Acidobacteria bacterium]|nr:hypothetical protein [Acidobacteriota bacterium]
MILQARHGLGLVHAASDLRRRTIDLDPELLKSAPEFIRITVHELFHFVWRRLDNGTRRGWRALLDQEIAAAVPGELGWSAEWRKVKIVADGGSAGRWRDYACESFCDTAAWYFSPRRRHEEFTLSARARAKRRKWFDRLLDTRQLPL